jgi:hypothetical protein
MLQIFSDNPAKPCEKVCKCDQMSSSLAIDNSQGFGAFWPVFAGSSKCSMAVRHVSCPDDRREREPQVTDERLIA